MMIIKQHDSQKLIHSHKNQMPSLNQQFLQPLPTKDFLEKIFMLSIEHKHRGHVEKNP